MRKKEEQKVVLPEYFDYNRKKEEIQDAVKSTFAFYYDCGIDVLGKDFTGRRGRKEFSYMLREIFLESKETRAEITIKGLGNYLAKVVDIDVVKDDDNKFRPVFEIMVISDYEEGNEFLAQELDHTTRIFYKGGWGNCLMDAIDSVVGEMCDCMNVAFTNDYRSLPKDKQ